MEKSGLAMQDYVKYAGDPVYLTLFVHLILGLCAICITTLSWHNLHCMTTIHLVMKYKLYSTCSVVVTMYLKYKLWPQSQLN